MNSAENESVFVIMKDIKKKKAMESQRCFVGWVGFFSEIRLEQFQEDPLKKNYKLF